ncbi:LRRCT domain-containing protein [Nephila pilipes]|uniref:LRRCT domain-containing protein n=1 Tax=Nephila pilipes TaxID=299642 RepID=A0A8X6MTJ3_NEPPI|nr:LRRCT domain-containing protein [Nephila pilipes]
MHVVTSERGCPPLEDIEPCTCQESYYTDLRCSSINEDDVITKVFANTKRYHFHKFTLKHSTLQYIPHTVFDNVEVKFLDFYEVTFVNTFDEIPKNPGVETIKLAKVRIVRGWDWSKLSIFTELRQLSITDVSMKRLSVDFKPNITKKLKELMLSWCSIKKFRANEFEEFKDLEIFTASHDEISEIKRTMFSRPSSLKRISFEYNKISRIPEDMFEDMSDLMFINLSHNLISVVPQNAFRPVIEHLTYFYLQDNPIKCDCLIHWLTFKKIPNFYGICESPKKFHGRNIATLRPQEFRC